MKVSAPKIVLAILLVMFLSSCANSVKIKDTWRSTEAPAVVYNKLLVVADTRNSSLREMLENITVEMLNEHGVAAMQSYPLISDLVKADRDTLQSLAKEAGADAVVITRAISKSEHTDYQYFGGNVQQRTAVIEKSDQNSSTVIAMSVVGIAPRETDFVDGFLQTRFFDAASAKLVWLAHSKVVNDGRKADACWDFSILLIKALAEDGMIEVNTKEFRKPSL